MRHYLTDKLLAFAKAQDSGRGEQRGGKYAARIQIGVEDDGSPKYRYFDSPEEYQAYLKGSKKADVSNSKVQDSKRLKDRTKREQVHSKLKQEVNTTRARGRARAKRSDLLGGKTKEDETSKEEKKEREEQAEKSLRLYLRGFPS